MPTTRPRILVTLRPSTAAVLRRMSELSGNSQSAIVGQLLEESEPIFTRMCRVLEAARNAKEGVKVRVRESLEAAEQVLDRQLGLMLDSAEAMPQDMLAAMEHVQRRAARGGGESGPVGAGKAAPAPDREPRRPPSLTGGSQLPTGRRRRARGRRGKGR